MLITEQTKQVSGLLLGVRAVARNQSAAKTAGVSLGWDWDGWDGDGWDGDSWDGDGWDGDGWDGDF